MKGRGMMNTNYKDKTVLIIGGSGSWGKELSRQLIAQDVMKIIIFSRGEISQVEMERSFNNNIIEFVIGDVRDERAIACVFANNNVDFVFHLAALKHVPVCENQPWEAILTNIYGIKNIIDACMSAKVKKFIYVSTDKAVDPYNVYGLTKAIGEKLVTQANCLTKDTDFICIRSGNVLGTNGSLVPYVIKQIETSNTVKITDSRMTRFFTTFTDAVKFLLFAAYEGMGGCIYVPNMDSFYITDVVDILVSHYGNKDTIINTIGMREGEKIHEVLISPQELGRTYSWDNFYFTIYPELDLKRDVTPKLGVLDKKTTTVVSSATNLASKERLFNILTRGNLLKENNEKYS